MSSCTLTLVHTAACTYSPRPHSGRNGTDYILEKNGIIRKISWKRNIDLPGKWMISYSYTYLRLGGALYLFICFMDAKISFSSWLLCLAMNTEYNAEVFFKCQRLQSVLFAHKNELSTRLGVSFPILYFQSAIEFLSAHTSPFERTNLSSST